MRAMLFHGMARSLRKCTVKLWDARDGRLLSTLSGHTEDVNSVAMSANGRLVASAADDKTIRVWQLPGPRLLALLQRPPELLRAALAAAVCPGTKAAHRRLCRLDPDQAGRNLP